MVRMHIVIAILQITLCITHVGQGVPESVLNPMDLHLSGSDLILVG